MHRFMTFVNGSNLFGAFKYLDVFVDDYEALYRHIFEKTVDRWRMTFSSPTPPTAQHIRVYWHVVDAMDEWDLSNPKTRQHLIERFLEDREVRARWMAEASRMLAGTGADQSRIEQTAFSMCFDDFKGWYEKRQSILGGMNRFHHAIEASSDFIEVCRCGRWKVDLLHKTVTEKGLDVCLAVDLLGLHPNYEVAVLVAADSDGIASLDYLKSRGKQVAVIEFQKGYPPEGRPKSFVSPLKLTADFLVPIYEMELVKQGIASKGEGNGFTLREPGS